MKILGFAAATLILMQFSVTHAGAADAAKGQGVYMNFCAPCHATGVAGAPKVGDRAAWAPRLKQGEKKLTERAIKGYQGPAGFMPARGGNSALSDAEVAGAVTYMITQSK